MLYFVREKWKINLLVCVNKELNPLKLLLSERGTMYMSPFSYPTKYIDDNT